jgi:hypothetical protein
MKRLTREQRVDMALATLGYPVGGDNIRVVLEKLVSDIKTQDKADCEAEKREIFAEIWEAMSEGQPTSFYLLPVKAYSLIRNKYLGETKLKGE